MFDILLIFNFFSSLPDFFHLFHSIVDGIKTFIGDVGLVQNWWKYLLAASGVAGVTKFFEALTRKREPNSEDVDSKQSSAPSFLWRWIATPLLNLPYALKEGLLYTIIFYPAFFARGINILSGVDPKTLESCPPAERIKITSLSVWLVLSSSFVFLLNLHAFKTMLADRPDAAAIPYIVAAMVSLTLFRFDANLMGWSHYADGVRAYHDAPDEYKTRGVGVNLPRENYEEQKRLIGRQRYWRIVISLGISFVVSLFMLMDMYKSAMDRVQDQFVRDKNPDFYAKMQKVDDDVKAEEAALKAKYETWSGQALTIAQHILESGAPAYKNSERYKSLQTELDQSTAKISSIQADIKITNNLITSEENGTNGHPPGCSNYCYAQKARLKELQNLEATENAERERILSDIEKLSQGVGSIDPISAPQSQSEVAKATEIMRADAERRADEATKTYDQYIHDEVARKENMKEALRKGTTGVTDIQDFYMRWFNLLALFVAGDTFIQCIGNAVGMLVFSLMVIIFIMLVEMLPVIAKMFFSHDTEYGLRLFIACEEARARHIAGMNERIWQRMQRSGASRATRDADRAVADKIAGKAETLKDATGTLGEASAI